jgi:AcrR family transcriptional regulator
MLDAKPRPARERLLDAASELTYARGITATGVDAIAAAAGVTKRTLYQHFDGKDALIAASLERRDQPAIGSLRRAALRRAAEEGSPPVVALFDVIERALAGPAVRGCAFLNAGLEIGDPASPVVAAAKAHLDARVRLVGELLAESGIDDPEVTEEITLLVDGTFAAAAVRHDPTVARHARRATQRLLARRK